MKKPNFGNRKPSIFDKQFSRIKHSKKKEVMPLYGAMDFARRNDMLTAEEVQACIAGTMHIEGSKLHGLPLGSSWVSYIAPTELYPGRATQLKIYALLGLDKEPGS